MASDFTIAAYVALGIAVWSGSGILFFRIARQSWIRRHGHAFPPPIGYVGSALFGFCMLGAVIAERSLNRSDRGK